MRSRVARLVPIAACLVMLLPSVADACPVCFRDPESPMAAGIAAGVGTLLAVTASVLGGFVVLIRRLVRAERDVGAGAPEGTAA